MNDPLPHPLIWYAGELIVAAIILVVAVAWSHWREEKRRRRMSRWRGE